ncbi:MAG: hypothetical protein M3R02_28065 [Chloroflexota bacterium]|nr:hypothetical protein [Chloroflexota bacterium]
MGAARPTWYDGGTGIVTGRSYTGEGVTTANLSSRVLADLITETNSALTQLPMATHRSWNWAPEPLRWLGVKFVTRCCQKLLRQIRQDPALVGAMPIGSGCRSRGRGMPRPTRAN